MNIEEQIKEILNKYIVYGEQFLLEELTNLLTQQREEAVRGFVGYCDEKHSIFSDSFLRVLYKYKEEYLVDLTHEGFGKPVKGSNKAV